MQKTPSKEEFKQIDWKEMISSLEGRTVDYFYERLFDKAKELEDQGNTKASRAYRFLGDICSISLKDNDPSKPFQPQIVLPNGRTASIEDFSDEDLDLMNQLLKDVENSDLKARISDILWTKRRDHEAAETAFEAYLASAKDILDHESWNKCFTRIERAFQIATLLGNEELQKKAQDFAIDILDEIDSEHPKLTYDLLNLLFEYDLGELQNLAHRIKKAAEIAESEDKFREAKNLWILKAKIEKKRGDKDKANDSEIHAGEAILKEAEKAQSHSLVASLLPNAIELFRRAGASEKANKVHEQLLEEQEKSTEELGYVETTVDLTKEIKKAREAVSGKELNDALKRFALITFPPKKEEIKREIEKVVEDHPMSALLPTTIISEEGKTVAKRGSVIGPNAEEEAVRAEVVREFQRYCIVEVQGRIQAARKQIMLEHRIKLSDLVKLCSYNPVVPPGRELIFARGLYYGFLGDFMTANHLLVPQIEHTLRYLLKQKGTITSSLRSDAIQEEYSLNTLLKMDETEEILGEDIVFALDSILNSKFGSNFRHRIAHGLLDYDNFNSVTGVYTWWLVHHLIFRSIVAISESKNSASDES